MPFRPTPGLLVIGAIAVIAIIVVLAALASPNTSRPSNPKGVLTCTVSSNVGLYNVKITNQNTGASITKMAADLPYSFNFTSSDTLMFNATVIDQYQWNAWSFPNAERTFDSHNPLTLKSDRNIIIVADCIIKQPN